MDDLGSAKPFCSVILGGKNLLTYFTDEETEIEKETR